MGYNRILFKLSGEALAGQVGFGIDHSRVSEIVDEVAGLVREGTQIALVVGGGNFFRGNTSTNSDLRRISIDYMGMLATVINAVAVKDHFISCGVPADLLSAIDMPPIAEPFSPARAIALLDAGRVVVFAAGTGSPYFSTDTAAALRAVEIEADLVAKATKVDGVYDKDPVSFPDAQKYAKISYDEVLRSGLEVMDQSAIVMCRENRIPLVVFDLNVRGNISKVAAGENVGTLIQATG